MLGAGHAMRADALGWESTQAIFVADRLPVSQRALVLAHSGGAGAEQGCSQHAGAAGEKSSVKCAHDADDSVPAEWEAKREIARKTGASLGIA
jgi:hypothetical protein